MNQEENLTQLIDQYLAGELSPEMKHELELRIKEDATFEEQVKAQHLIKMSFERKWEKDTMAQLATFRAKLDAEAPAQEKRSPFNVSRNRWSFAAAAAIVLIVLSAAWYFTRKIHYSDQPLHNMIVYTVPLYEEAENELGFGPSNTLVDSLVVVILPTHEKLVQYQFMDTLNLFLVPPLPNTLRLKVSYNRPRELYTMLLNDTSYVIERGYANVRPLKKVQ